MRSRSCLRRNCTTISSPKVKDTPRSFSPHPMISRSGSDHSRSHNNPAHQSRGHARGGGDIESWRLELVSRWIARVGLSRVGLSCVVCSCATYCWGDVCWIPSRLECSASTSVRIDRLSACILAACGTWETKVARHAIPSWFA